MTKKKSRKKLLEQEKKTWKGAKNYWTEREKEGENNAWKRRERKENGGKK